MADIGIKVVSCNNIAAVVKILRGFTSKSISEIKNAIENKEYVFEGSSYEDEDLEKLIDCYKKLQEAGIDSELYEDGRMISLEILQNLQQRNYEIQNEIDVQISLSIYNEEDLFTTNSIPCFCLEIDIIVKSVKDCECRILSAGNE